MIRTPKTGIVIVFIIAAYVLASLWALLSYSSLGNFSDLMTDAYYLHVAKFSFYQASLSTLLSVGFALPVAHALSRRQFIGRGLLLKVFGTTLVLPVLVGVFGIIAMYGNQGVLAQFLSVFDAKLPFSIYGLNGILIAHVFFNLPFSTRLLLMTIESVPTEQRRLAKHLGMSSWTCFKLVEWPRIKQHLPHIIGLVFMLCFTSFATVMALGGGPKATTIELAIYQAIKFDFDLQVGAVLAIWQMAICSLLVLFVGRFSRVVEGGSAFGVASLIQPLDSWRKRVWDTFWIMVSLLLVAPPLLMVIIAGLNQKIFDVLTDVVFWQSFFSSIQVAFVSATIALVAGVLILSSTRMLRLKEQLRLADKVELVGTVILVTPALVLSTATFLMLRGVTDVFSLAVVIVVLVNALMALPFVIKTLNQPMLQLATQYHLLWQSLGILGVARFFSMEWRALRAPLMHAFSMSFILSLGDLTVIALFGSQDFKTLPLYLYQLLGSYQMQAAAVVSLVLFTVSIGMFSLTERLVVKDKQRSAL